MKASGLGLLALPLLAASPAEAQDWRAIGFGGADAETMLLYLDQTSFKRSSATTRELTIAGAYEQPRSFVGELKYSWTKTSYTIDCAAKTARTLLAVFYDAKGEPLISSSKPGNPINLDATAMVPKALSRACSGDFATLYQGTTGPLYPDAAQRFAWRSALRGSTRKTGWVRVGTEGVAPRRMTTFVHRASIVTDSAGRKLVPLLTITEGGTVAATNRYFNYTRFHCAASLRTNLYAELYGADGSSKGGMFPGSGDETMDGRSLFSAPAAPICRNDWSKTREFSVSPGSLPLLAFAP